MIELLWYFGSALFIVGVVIIVLIMRVLGKITEEDDVSDYCSSGYHDDTLDRFDEPTKGR